MPRLLPYTLFTILSGVAGIHVYWAFGGVWPAIDEQSLIATVIGDPRFERMPSQSVTLAVAIVIFLAGGFALARGGLFRWLPGWFSRLAVIVISCVFLGRGLFGLAVGWGVLSVDPVAMEPFATFDLRYYSPLCLALGLGFAALAAHPRRG